MLDLYMELGLGFKHLFMLLYEAVYFLFPEIDVALQA